MRRLLALAGLVLLVAASAFAASPVGDGSAGGPATIGIAFEPHAIGISPGDPGTFEVRGILTLAFDLGTLGDTIDRTVLEPGRYEGATAERIAEASRLPEIVVLNDIGTAWPSALLYVTNEGRAIFTRSLTALVRPPSAFHAFPFDRHAVPVIFSILNRQVDEMRLELRPEIVIDPLFARTRSTGYGSFRFVGDPPIVTEEAVEGIGTFSTAAYGYRLERHIVFYLYAAFVPPLLLLGLICMVPWLPDLKFMDVSRLNATVLLAIFANMLVMEADVPDGNFLTVLDAFDLVVITFGSLVILLEFLHHGRRGPQGVALPAPDRRLVARTTLGLYLALWAAVAAGVVWHLSG